MKLGLMLRHNHLAVLQRVQVFVWQSLLRNSNCAEIPPTLEHIFCYAWFPKKKHKNWRSHWENSKVPNIHKHSHLETQTGFLKFSQNFPLQAVTIVTGLQPSQRGLLVARLQRHRVWNSYGHCRSKGLWWTTGGEFEANAIGCRIELCQSTNGKSGRWDLARLAFTVALLFFWRFRCCCVKWPLRVCEDIKTFVSVSAQQKCQTFWVLKCLKDPRLHGACRITSGVFPFFLEKRNWWHRSSWWSPMLWNAKCVLLEHGVIEGIG